MAMKESLSGISTELGKILQQLKEIESVQGRLGASAGSYAKALSGVGSGVSSTGGSGFSTPPPAPGSQAGGVMGTTPSGGTGAPTGGGSGAGAGIAAGIGAIATAGYNFLPSTQDSVFYQSAFFRASFTGAGGYKQDDLAKMRAMFGRRQSDPFGMITAANMASMSGMGIGTSQFSTVMRQTATTSMLFGQSNATAAQAQTSLYSGPTAGRLGNIGIFVSSLSTGDPRAFGDIIDQIWGRAYGGKNVKVPYESVMADLRGGYLGAWLRRNFSDNPALYDQIYQGLVLKANSNARTLDYSDLTGKNGLNRVTAGTGQASAMGSGMSLGLNENNDPMYFASRGYGAQARAIEGAMSEMVTAWQNVMNPLISATEAYADTMEDGTNTLMNAITALKGYVQTISGNSVLGSLLGGVGGIGSGIAGGFLARTLFQARAGGGTPKAATPGTSSASAARSGIRGGGTGGAIAAIAGVLALDRLLPEGPIKDAIFGEAQDPYDPSSPITREDLLRPRSMSYNARGGYGTTTSDSILARLSKGEYVINARAAQQIGKKNLDALNSVGHSLGSGYASPAKAFAKGGSTTGGGISEVVALAKKFSHLPYSSSPVVPVDKDGNPTGWGCATSVAWLYEKGAGITLPSRSLSYDQWRGLSQTVSEASMQPGDLIFQRNNGPSRANDNPVNHVEMYLGPGQVFNGGVGIQRSSSYPPVKNGVKRVTGGGNAIGASTPIMDGSPATAERSTTLTPAGLLPVSSSLTATRPNAFSLGGFTGGAKGLSLGISTAFSWIGGSLFGTTQRGGITSAGIAQRESTDDTATTTGKSEAMAEPTGGVGSGSGPAWLYKYLVSKGLRGNTLHKAWVIGMRESGGNPKLQSKDKYGGSWTSSGSPHYDVGLYQINNRHLSTVQKRYGGDMRQMLDLEKNYDMTTYMSNNWNNLLAWALESDGQTFNWSMYNPVPSWAGASMANHRRLWGEYDKYNTQNYSEGAYRTHEGMAKIHEGEMVLPANVAERFREMMREAGGPRGGSRGDVNITLKIEKASEAEAERFARKVKKLLETDSWESAMRTR